MVKQMQMGMGSADHSRCLHCPRSVWLNAAGKRRATATLGSRRAHARGDPIWCLFAVLLRVLLLLVRTKFFFYFFL